MPQTTDALQILDRVTGKGRMVRASIAAARIDCDVAQMIYNARSKAGLSQGELAARIGSKQPVIARLEDADYGGHSLNMLRRIAAALSLRLEVRFVPQKNSHSVAGAPAHNRPRRGLRRAS